MVDFHSSPFMQYSQCLSHSSLYLPSLTLSLSPCECLCTFSAYAPCKQFIGVCEYENVWKIPLNNCILLHFIPIGSLGLSQQQQKGGAIDNIKIEWVEKCYFWNSTFIFVCFKTISNGSCYRCGGKALEWGWIHCAMNKTGPYQNQIIGCVNDFLSIDLWIECYGDPLIHIHHAMPGHAKRTWVPLWWW